MPTRLDPTRTTTLRNKFQSDMRMRFWRIRSGVIQLIDKLDVLGLKESEPLSFNSLTVNIEFPEKQAWRFRTDEQKLVAFKQWLQEQIDQEILSVEGATGEPWTRKYIHSAYKRGSMRAYTDARAEELADTPEFYQGSRAQFLESAFNSPERLSKIKFISTRTFEELKGITSAMSQQMGRILGNGLTQGLGPRTIARQLSKNITGITKKRALTLARTEVIAAHSEGQLDSFEELNIEKVGVMAEWSTAGDDRVCPLCQPLDGVVMTVKEARGLIPRHPNCRCAWIPANVGELEKRKKRYWSIIGKKKQVNKSLKAELPKKTRSGEKVPQTVKAAKSRSTWAGKEVKYQSPPEEKS